MMKRDKEGDVGQFKGLKNSVKINDSNNPQRKYQIAFKEDNKIDFEQKLNKIIEDKGDERMEFIHDERDEWLRVENKFMAT